MAMEESILKSTKKLLGYEHDGAFDLDVITHINTAFFTLYQLGIGPPSGFMIQGEDEVWDDYTSGRVNLNSVKTYVYAKVRSLFDAPGTPHHLAALNEQITELEHRLKMERETNAWVPQSSSHSLP